MLNLNSKAKQMIVFLCLLLNCNYIVNGRSVARDMKSEDVASYMQTREQFVDLDRRYRIGNNIKLSTAESKLNKKIVELKSQEIHNGRVLGNYPPAIHFFKGKKLIEMSPIFNLILEMPKGAALHLHDVSITDAWWIVKNVTYRDNCYMCQNKTSSITQFHFFSTPPSTSDCPWILVDTARNKSSNIDQFDSMLYSKFSLEVDDPATAYPDLATVWKAFGTKLIAAEGLLFYVPVYRDYFIEGLQQFTDDNVQSMELRSLLPQLYDLDGKTYESEFTLQLYINSSQLFKKKNTEDTMGAKFIYTGLRFWDDETVASSIELAQDLHKRYAEMLGYDLVGQEGSPLSRSLLSYLPQLLKPRGSLPYFFHAGETDWKGTEVDENLFDAILLNTSRIGHGYALTRHPHALQEVLEKKIPIEVNPISNQVLKLVDDLRNHPGSVFMSDGVPMCISADDPGVWGARGLSYDFYMAFMGFGGNYSDLTTLKQLALNSIEYSVLEDSEYILYMQMFNRKWDAFVNSALLRFGLI